MRKLKLYLDTSVWNFYYADDSPEKMEVTRQFFESLSSGNYEIYSSAVVIREIDNADENTMSELITLMNKYKPIILEVEDLEMITGIKLIRRFPEKPVTAG